MFGIKSAHDIGYNGTPDDVRKKLDKLAGFSPSKEDKRFELAAGAAAAFREGRAENMQAVMEKITSYSSYAYYHNYPLVDIVSLLVKGNAEAAEDLRTATATLSDEKRDALLGKALLEALHNDTNETLCAPLLEAGADPNYKGGQPLIEACTCNRPLSTLQMLHDAGADLDTALTTMYTAGHTIENIDRMKFCRDKIEGTPVEVKKEEAAPAAAGEDDDIRAMMRQMITLMEEITRRLPPEGTAWPANTNTPPAPAAETPKPATGLRGDYSKVLGPKGP